MIVLHDITQPVNVRSAACERIRSELVPISILQRSHVNFPGYTVRDQKSGTRPGRGSSSSGSGHFALDEATDEIASLVRNFLERNHGDSAELDAAKFN
ncbi:hypothetical protein ABID58_002140 [Bradyrhizobium sp. S3.2.6]|uniref:hypothetical protein n=1 Tax=unclassified Bradyrhizobium TaxID=2631580 RepID=UPI00339B4AB9